MRLIDGDRLIEWLKENEAKGRVLNLPDIRFIVSELAKQREIEDVGAEPETRLYTAEEMQHLPDRKTVCVERLISREDEERGYVTGCGWGVVWNRTGASDGGMIVAGLLGRFFTNTITEIPFEAMETNNDGDRITALYRFWTNRPTDEQSREASWDDPR